MDGINNISNAEITYRIYSTEDAMKPPEEEQRVSVTDKVTEHYEEEAEVKLLQPGEPIQLEGFKFKPIDGQYAFRHLSPMERLGQLGNFNPIRNVNLYTIRQMYRGIGSIINIRI